MSKINIAIAGVGNCSSALVQGVQYYIENPEDKIGLMELKVIFKFHYTIFPFKIKVL